MKILAAIDGSASALRALQYVLDHPDFFGAAPEVVLVHVHLPVPSPRARAVLGSTVIDQYYRDEADEALAPARALLAPTACKVLERTIIGQPAPQIIGAAQQHECDMIVMGTHGRSAIENLFLGSVAMRVVAGSQIPVLSVR